jgi:predicted extracellular nuclease
MRRVSVVAATAATAALLLTGLTAPAVAAEGDELFISEYIEGSSNNKAIEIYNPTDAPVDLTAYTVRFFFNGSLTSGLSIPLTGTVAAGDVHVLAQASANATILAQADQTNGAGWFNGDDAITLTKGDAVVDSFGQIGSDPGTEWGTALTSSADNTLRRLPSVCAGDTDPSNAFDPSLEWEGLATDTFDGLGAHTCGEIEPTVVINEFSASTTGTDVEYVELLATPGTDLSAYRVLSVEGDTPTLGILDRVVEFSAPDASGRSLATLPANALENGTMSLLLVTGTIPAVGTDLDANDDGAIDESFGLTVVDAVAVNDGTAGDLTYGGVTLGVSYDGLPFAPGGASRIPDGTDTDTTSDWVRNDFDLAGIPGSTGTLVDGEAANTPGAANSLTVVTDPGPGEGDADCTAETVSIGAVQGAGAASPLAGQTVRVEGTVVADYQAAGGLTGYFLQDGGDGDPATSDGIFVYAPGAGALDVSVGDVVNVAGAVSEFASAGGSLTEITANDAELCSSGAPLPAPVSVTLPAGPEIYEAIEGMYVTFPQTLSILEYFEFGRFGSIDVGVTRQMQPTAVYEPGSPEAIALAAKNASERITLDDGRGVQNPDPALHPNGAEFTLQNTFRGGDTLTNITGVLDYRFGGWTVQPTEGADYAAANPRPAAPELGGDITVASFNVLNYFTTLNSRGANTPEEFERQEAKIVSALAAIDADVVGLIEIENNATAVATLTAALNEKVGAGTYSYIDTGVIGTDEITTALIYKPSTVEPLGDEAVLDSSIDPDFADNNRPALAQTFEQVGGSESVTVVVNHLKSKGSACAGDPDLGDGAGNCNITRTKAAAALAKWLATDPTGQGAGRELIIGDLNSYDKEDPIDALRTAGYTDLLLEFQGENAYSYVFDGQLGYLDYALAGTDLVEDVTGAQVWLINADEPSLIDYDMDFKQPAQDALWAPDPYRSSDHDPVVVGLELTPPDTTPPTITATADPALVFPPNGKPRAVTITVDAADESGDVTVELIETTATGNKKARITEISDTSFTVIAAVGSVYTFTYEATDAAGNTATATAEVRVGP